MDLFSPEDNPTTDFLNCVLSKVQCNTEKPSPFNIDSVKNFWSVNNIYDNKKIEVINRLLENDDAFHTIQKALIELHLDCILKKS